LSKMSTAAGSAAIVLVVGAGGLAGIIASVYLLTIIFDRYCFCCPQGIALEHLRFLQGGAIARQAGLLSLSSKERRKILSKLLNSQVSNQYLPLPLPLSLQT
jgi:hypothetical protein